MAIAFKPKPFPHLVSQLLNQARRFSSGASGVAFCFPGQGSQYVGMCFDGVQEIPAAANLMSEASEILGYDLFKVCTEGPKELLDTTAISQPAIFVASLCAVEKLKIEQNGNQILSQVNACMGLSLGEYSALCFADAISFEDGVKLTQHRGEAMQAASKMQPTGMLTLVGLNQDKVEELCEHTHAATGKSIQIGNYLSPDMFALSGHQEACEYVLKLAKNITSEFTPRLAKQLPVAGAFHTEYMRPAVETLKATLDLVEVRPPLIPVFSNVTGDYHSNNSDDIKELLLQQVTSPVQFTRILRNVMKKEAVVFEIGPGKAISSIVKRTSKRVQVNSVQI